MTKEAKNKYNIHRGTLFIKRTFDIGASAVGILLLAVPFACVALAIKLDSKGPVFFRQKRVGRYKKDFEIYKFRTMVAHAPSVGAQITKDKDPRITKLGSFLRKYKLDEFPQLLNVLKGDMSLVGPRPEVRSYVEAYEGYDDEIFSIRPGITDLASIEFKEEAKYFNEDMTPEEIQEKYVEEILPIKVGLMKKYMRNMSLGQDLKIIFRTLGVLK